MGEPWPSWIAVADDWEADTRMANRSYRPPRLSYERWGWSDDQRLKYLLYFMDFRDLRVLELGPRRGHHSIMLEKLGVRETVSVEGRPENYERCLRTKERYGLDKTQFYLADIEALAAGEKAPFHGPFDLVFCAGLLYHLAEPGRALEWFRTQAPSLFLQTQYVEEAAPESYPKPVFRAGMYPHNGREYPTLILRENEQNPRGGLAGYSTWLYERDLIFLIEEAGFGRVHVLGKDLGGAPFVARPRRTPHISILAEAEANESPAPGPV